GATTEVLPGWEAPPSGRSVEHLGDRPRGHRLAALADGEAEPFLHGNGLAQLDGHGARVAGHHHLAAVRQQHRAVDVGGAEEELGPVAVEERLVPATLLGT